MKSALTFDDRKQAGILLGKYLAQTYKGSDILVIGIPRGGVETAYYVAKALNAELSVIVSKKLPYPGHSEYGFGAVTEEDTVYVNDTSSKMISRDVIDQIIDNQKLEIKRRVKSYRNDKPLPELRNRTVILVDDGIATGATLVPVVRLCRKKHAAKVVVAAPVSGTSYDEHLKEADAIEVLVQPRDFYAVGQVYRKFGDFSDEELQDIMRKAERERETMSGVHH
ncbi:MAG TPA: phosphoribosyltransferase family protein [Mucilaginibacter sp.]